MNKPTREEVEKWKYESVHSPLHDHAFENHNRLICLADAYLAQEEELKRKGGLIKMQDGFITDKSKIAAERSTHISQLEVELDQLKAENQALKEALEGIDSLERYTHLYGDTNHD